MIEFRELFAVRAGRFPDHAAANRLLRAIRTLYPDAFILFVKHERIFKALKGPPLGDPITSHNKAKELIGKEEYGKALNLLSPFAADPLRYPEIASDYIVLLIWEGREKEAIRLYESLPPPFPRRLYLLENMGRAYYDEGAFKDSSRLYRAALAKEPSSLEAKKGVIYSSIMEGDWPSAYKQLEELLTTLPNPIYVATESMMLLHSKGLSAEMVEVYRTIDRRYGGRGEEGLRARSNLLTLLPGETREALHSALLRKVEGGDTGLMEDYILTIIIGREYERAVSAIEESGLDLTSAPDETVAWVAWAYFKTGRIEQAKGYYKGILSSNPAYLRAELGLAYCFAVEGDDREAMEILDRLSVAEDDNIEVHFARAFAHEKAGRYWNAIEEYNRIIALAPDNRTAQKLRLQAMSDLGMTTEAIEAATRDLPGDSDLLTNLKGDQAIDHFYWDETGKALAVLTPLLEDGTNMRARFDYIATLIKQGDGEKAVEAYEKLLQEGITPPAWLIGPVAAEYLSLGRPSLALQLYERALEEEPGSFINRMGKFHALQELREWAAAEKLLNAIDAGEPEVYWTGDAARPNWNKLEVALARGWFLIEQGRMREGEEHFTRLREKAPVNSGIRSGLAHIYLWRGWPRKALREFSVIESRDPENVDILTGKIGALNEVGFKRKARDTAASLSRQTIQRTCMLRTLRASLR